MWLQELLWHGAGADQRFNTTDHAFTGNTCLEHELVHVELQFFDPVFRCDVYTHRFGKVMDTEYNVFHRTVLHQIRCDFERFRVLDNRLNGDIGIHAQQETRQVAHFSRTVGLAGFGQHHHIDVFTHIAHQLHIELVFISTERIGADRDSHALVHLAQFRQLLTQQVAAHFLLPAAILKVKNQGMGMGVVRMFLHTRRGLCHIFINSQAGRIFHRWIIQLDTGPVIAQRTCI